MNYLKCRTNELQHKSGIWAHSSQIFFKRFVQRKTFEELPLINEVKTKSKQWLLIILCSYYLWSSNLDLGILNIFSNFSFLTFNLMPCRCISFLHVNLMSLEILVEHLLTNFFHLQNLFYSLQIQVFGWQCGWHFSHFFTGVIYSSIDLFFRLEEVIWSWPFFHSPKICTMWARYTRVAKVLFWPDVPFLPSAV